MGIAFLAVEEAAQAERAGQASAVDGPVQDQVAGRDAGTKAAVGLDLLGQLAFDALEIVRVRIHLAPVLERDVLGDVILGAHREGHLARAGGVLDLDMFLARLHAERNADHGDPLLALFPHDQHAPVLVGDLGRASRVAQRQDGHPARHSGVELAADVAALLRPRGPGQAQAGRGQPGAQDVAAFEHGAYRHRLAGSMMVWSRRAMRVDRRVSVLPCQWVVVMTASTPRLPCRMSS